MRLAWELHGMDRMSKRSFRSRKQKQQNPTYPTLDRGRRDFLVMLGGAILGAGALAACGDRVVNAQPDTMTGPAGEPPMPDAGLDGQLEPDLTIESGVAPMPDAEQDKLDMGLAGARPPPDAEIDKAEMQVSPGYAPNMDSAIDDSGSCPIP